MRNSSSYNLSGYRGFTGRGSKEGHDNNIFFKGSRFVPHEWLHTKIAAFGMDLRIVVWVKEVVFTQI